MRKIISSHKLWLFLVFTFSFLFLLASYVPNIYEASVVDLMPKDRVMLWGEHIYTYDYNVYLSKMKQGAEGRWSIVDKYDNNPNQKGVFLQMLYLLSGKVGGVLRISPPLTFHLLRTILSFLWILTIIYLNVFFLKTPKRYTIGILLSLLAASFPVFYRYQNQWWVGYHMFWWTEMDVLKRISYIPHYTLNYIIIAILAILLSKFEIRSTKSETITKIQKPNDKNKKKVLNFENSNLEFVSRFGFRISDFILICIILFFSFFIHPSAGILFLFSWIIYHLIFTTLMRPHQIGYFLQLLIFTLILFTVAAIPLIYFKSATSNYPWKSLTDFDKYSRFPLNVKEYILALGPIFFTGVLGIIVALIKKDQKLFSLVSWILGAFIAMFIFKKFPYQSELRFVQTANHIPLAILSVYFLSWFWVRFSWFFIKVITILIIITIISLGLVQSYFSIRSQTDFIHQRAVAGQPLVPYPPQVMYPLKDFWNALIWLEKNTSRQDVVLSQVTAGNYIPAYSGNFVYLGHNPETPHYDERVNKVNQFFSGSMNEKDALKFLQEEYINYVFYGPQEKAVPRTESLELSGTGEKSVEDIKKYSFLKPVLSLSFLTLYQVNKIK
ncbi:hypothetical protein A3A46_02845 [Candidatus Roizmanbacteria bacterium RIFCSPLOWO2_01_FULL_37_13]|uniref:Glycosyltransferase RgtA/B/C/D-like domain-containing protein n=1 Tax=Candidatus Roizmanbacteria bacterium RIFCSPHIGHO2_02_FULL_38_11 TaxID=1802039 RepID=A0A1F7H2N7_9BACT|nr:MAG: hypothetical protein A3C25_00075 [Candidatus Roizmanbacteria bacterium RIFCSPHIGHO2_02_FULL_38_11]OGK34269.1 MAG: hypothetical protein A3F58_02925 [Candidatus Roizmanbacteria bacterium RIFCSPHIGHO2_12_FULL_37_9b]OGK43061.1 MAG: hypothetical protein A3A46_02845 [Candidatus Roizmanbacteria bacterium RIFCSPLOWO2_01_FULL_37_13]